MLTSHSTYSRIDGYTTPLRCTNSERVSAVTERCDFDLLRRAKNLRINRVRAVNADRAPQATQYPNSLITRFGEEEHARTIASC